MHFKVIENGMLLFLNDSSSTLYYWAKLYKHKYPNLRMKNKYLMTKGLTYNKTFIGWSGNAKYYFTILLLGIEDHIMKRFATGRY